MIAPKDKPMNTVDQRAWKGKAMEGWVAWWYTRTRRKDMADFRREAKTVAERLNRGSNVLEVAPGPGFFAIELRRVAKKVSLGSYLI